MKKDGWILVYSDSLSPVPVGTALTLNGVACTLTGGAPPHKPSSQGKVWLDGLGFVMEVYPSVFGLQWVRPAQPAREEAQANCLI